MHSLKTALAIVFVPGAACFLIPYFILDAAGTPLERPVGILQVLALLAAAAGLYMIIWVGVAFVRQGKGRPVPLEPPTQLVVGGLYRYMRNPMYSGAVLIVLAEAAYFGSFYLLLYAAALWAVLHAALLTFEEKQLKQRFGAPYERYLAQVPRWIPRSGKPRPPQ